MRLRNPGDTRNLITPGWVDWSIFLHRAWVIATVVGLPSGAPFTPTGPSKPDLTRVRALHMCGGIDLVLNTLSIMWRYVGSLSRLDYLIRR